MTEKGKELVPECNIGLVGHVDHGKTTLTEALSGKWTDTHSEEIKRGISIKLGYADVGIYRCRKCSEPKCYSTTAKCMSCFGDCDPVRMVSLVDAPGHETLMATVLSGASIMDGAMLIIAANEECPQPQTREHLTVMDMVGIRNIVVVQTKIDLVSKEQALSNYQQIKAFLKGSVAESAPIIPVSARQRINLDVLVKAVEDNIKTPERDPRKPPKLLVARSFDVNRPGTDIESLVGGVLGGSLTQGKLKIGDEIEIRPGVKIKEKFEPVKTKVTGLHKAGKNLNEIGPGGLTGVSTSLDPCLTRSDSMAGSVLGLSGQLPPVISKLTMKTKMMERVVGTKDAEQVGETRTGTAVMLTVGTMRTTGVVSSASPGKMEVTLKNPVCADKGDNVALSKLFSGRWRLIGSGKVE